MVVPVLTSSRQVLEKWNKEPVTSQTMIVSAVSRKAPGAPTASDIFCANCGIDLSCSYASACGMRWLAGHCAEILS